MSPRKTRRGTKAESVDDSLQDVDVSKIADTPDTNRRILRTRRQLKQKNSSDSDVEPSPQLNESKRSARRGRGKKVIDNINDSLESVTVTSTRKRTRKDKDTSALVEETVIVEHDNRTPEPISAAKLKVNRSRKRHATKKSNVTTNDYDNAENLPNDENIIHNDVPEYLNESDIKNSITTDEKNNEVVDCQDLTSNEDNEVANMSKRATKRLGKTLTISRFLQPRSCNINSPNSIVTPECSPLTVNLTPHRATKTPRKSPINIGSPKTHSLSPQRLSKTPRKLPVTSNSPTPPDQLSINGIQTDSVTNETNNKSKISSPKNKTAIRTSSRKVSKSPKIVLRTSKPKSPRKTSTKLKKSPNLKKSLQVSDNSLRVVSPKKINSPSIQNIEKVTKSPLLVLDRITTTAKILPATENIITPVVTPSAWKELIQGIESPRRQRTTGKKRSPISDCATPLRPVETSKLNNDTSEISEKSQITSTNNTPLVVERKTKSAMTSSTPRERIRRSLNLSPGLDPSLTVSGTPLSVETFYGTSLKTSTNIVDNNKIAKIEDESNILFTDDDLSFNISGVKAVETSQSNATLIENNSKVEKTPETEDTNAMNDTYELAEPVTPGLKKRNKTANDTYELDEPKTPSLRKKRSLVDVNLSVAENNDEELPTKRICRVRFASPPLNSPTKVVSKDSISSRSSTPANRGLRKRTFGQSDNTNMNDSKLVKPTIRPRRRSNSLTNLSEETPKNLSIKKRSLSVVDVSSRSVQKNIQNESVNRLSKPRLSMSSNKKPEIKLTSARKIPNFAQIHQRKFAKMESLIDAKKRVEERHNTLTNNITVMPSTSKNVVNPTLQLNNTKVTPADIANGSFNRFGYRVRKEDATKLIKKQPSLKRSDEKKVEKRIQLKGVRTNRRFELQMKMRNINP